MMLTRCHFVCVITIKFKRYVTLFMLSMIKFTITLAFSMSGRSWNGWNSCVNCFSYFDVYLYDDIVTSNELIHFSVYLHQNNTHFRMNLYTYWCKRPYEYRTRLYRFNGYKINTNVAAAGYASSLTHW